MTQSRFVVFINSETKEPYPLKNMSVWQLSPDGNSALFISSSQPSVDYLSEGCLVLDCNYNKDVRKSKATKKEHLALQQSLQSQVTNKAIQFRFIPDINYGGNREKYPNLPLLGSGIEVESIEFLKGEFNLTAIDVTDLIKAPIGKYDYRHVWVDKIFSRIHQRQPSSVSTNATISVPFKKSESFIPGLSQFIGNESRFESSSKRSMLALTAFSNKQSVAPGKAPTKASIKDTRYQPYHVKKHSDNNNIKETQISVAQISSKAKDVSVGQIQIGERIDTIEVTTPEKPQEIIPKSISSAEKPKRPMYNSWVTASGKNVPSQADLQQNQWQQMAPRIATKQSISQWIKVSETPASNTQPSNLQARRVNTPSLAHAKTSQMLAGIPPQARSSGEMVQPRPQLITMKYLQHLQQVQQVINRQRSSQQPQGGSLPLPWNTRNLQTMRSSSIQNFITPTTATRRIPISTPQATPTRVPDNLHNQTGALPNVATQQVANRNQQAYMPNFNRPLRSSLMPPDVKLMNELIPYHQAYYGVYKNIIQELRADLQAPEFDTAIDLVEYKAQHGDIFVNVSKQFVANRMTKKKEDSNTFSVSSKIGMLDLPTWVKMVGSEGFSFAAMVAYFPLTLSPELQCAWKPTKEYPVIYIWQQHQMNIVVDSRIKRTLGDLLSAHDYLHITSEDESGYSLIVMGYSTWEAWLKQDTSLKSPWRLYPRQLVNEYSKLVKKEHEQLPKAFSEACESVLKNGLEKIYSLIDKELVKEYLAKNQKSIEKHFYNNILNILYGLATGSNVRKFSDYGTSLQQNNANIEIGMKKIFGEQFFKKSDNRAATFEFLDIFSQFLNGICPPSLNLNSLVGDIKSVSLPLTKLTVDFYLSKAMPSLTIEEKQIHDNGELDVLTQEFEKVQMEEKSQKLKLQQKKLELVNKRAALENLKQEARKSRISKKRTQNSSPTFFNVTNVPNAPKPNSSVSTLSGDRYLQLRQSNKS